MNLITVFGDTAARADVEAKTMIKSNGLIVQSLAKETVDSYNCAKAKNSVMVPPVPGFPQAITSTANKPVFLVHIYHT